MLNLLIKLGKIENQSGTSINKFISSTGYCSRREADKWLENGRVKLNGTIAKKGNRVFDGDEVSVDGKLITYKPKLVYIALNKPPGITCTSDKKDKDNIIDFIQHEERIFTIGRLDKGSSGLILLTNDGDIVNHILRAEYEHEKEYIVTVDKPITKNFIDKMSNGLPVLGTMTNKCVVEQLGKTQFKIILTQGLNRQIRRMCEFLEYKVRYLKRVRVMNIHLGKLGAGIWRNLTKEELAGLNYKKK